MILLTGASGYLGQHVAALFARRESIWEVGGPNTPRGCDLAKPEHAIMVLRGLQPHLVLHCAALVPKCPEDYEDEQAARNSANMTKYLRRHTQARMVFASTMSIHTETAYAKGKREAERTLKRSDVILRLPGLFGLPRRSGVIYEAARSGQIPTSFGPYPAMHVQDAAEYLVRAATMPSDGKPEPYSVVYGDPRLEATYGSLGVTFAQRVEQFREELQREQVNA